MGLIPAASRLASRSIADVFRSSVPGTDASAGRDRDRQDALVGLSLAEYYLMTWRTLRGLGSSHHGAGEKSLTKRTHMSVLLRVDEEEGRAQQQSGESASSLLAAKRNLGHGNQPGKLATTVFCGLGTARGAKPSTVWTLRDGQGEMVSQVIFSRGD